MRVDVEPSLTLRVPPLGMLALPLCLAVPGLELLHLAGKYQSPPLGSAAFLLLSESVWLLVLGLVLRVRLTQAGVRVRTLFRRRLVRWAEISAVTIEPQRLGGPRVTLWTTAGARVRLPVPMANKAWNQEAFVRDYHRIGQYWLASRGPTAGYPLPARPLAG